jgi:hypothetical protein
MAEPEPVLEFEPESETDVETESAEDPESGTELGTADPVEAEPEA